MVNRVIICKCNLHELNIKNSFVVLNSLLPTQLFFIFFLRITTYIKACFCK